MAKLEKSKGISSTYYFRWDSGLPGFEDVH
jgi:hypothetical protein